MLEAELLTDIPDLKFALDTGNLYYAGEDGARVTSSLVTVKGKTYYIEAKAMMKLNI